MNRRWLVKPYKPEIASSLTRELGLPPLIGRILATRGFEEPALTRQHLDPDLDGLHDPFLLSSMKKAVARIIKAIRAGEKIAVYGDYDVDGATSTSVLMLFFEHIQVVAERFIPSRMTDGYGLTIPALERLIEGGATLIISCDCGVSANGPIERANELGADLIVCDHHEPPQTLPPAHAILNPKLEGETYPFRELAAVGVAYKLACALAVQLGLTHNPTAEFRALLPELLALVAIGSVADVVPLVGENRILVTHGLAAISQSSNPGVQALCEVAKIGRKPVEAWHIGFQLGPRLNAGGRMGQSDLAASLLTCQSYDEALRIAETLDKINQERREAEQALTEQAKSQFETLYGDGSDSGIVLAGEGWHKGIIGIVAQRMVEAQYRPTAIIGSLNGDARGSVRSIPGISLPEVLDECADLLIGYGGHYFAAGFNIDPKQIEPFRTRFEDAVRKRLGSETLIPHLRIDAEAELGSLNLELARSLERLAPFGRDNPNPILASHNLEVVGQPKTMGKTGQHLQCHVRSNGASIRVVGFGQGDRVDEISRGQIISVAYRLTLNDWRGRSELEMHAQDIQLVQE